MPPARKNAAGQSKALRMRDTRGRLPQTFDNRVAALASRSTTRPCLRIASLDGRSAGVLAGWAAGVHACVRGRRRDAASPAAETAGLPAFGNPAAPRLNL